MRSILQHQLPALAVLLAMALSGAAAAEESTADIHQVGHCCEPACGCSGGACGDACCGGNCCDPGCCCRKVCVATVEKEKVEKHCWKTEAKDVCIPKVVLPWQHGGSGLTIFSFLKRRGACCGDACCGDACCGGCNTCGCCPKPRCGKVITVCDLKKEKYECDKCVCKWKIRRLPPCCDSPCCGTGGCCGDACCGDACCDPCCGANADPVTSEIQLTSSFDAAAATADAESQAGEQPAASAVKKTWLQRLKLSD